MRYIFEIILFLAKIPALFLMLFAFAILLLFRHKPSLDLGEKFLHGKLTEWEFDQFKTNLRYYSNHVAIILYLSIFAYYILK